MINTDTFYMYVSAGEGATVKQEQVAVRSDVPITLQSVEDDLQITKSLVDLGIVSLINDAYPSLSPAEYYGDSDKSPFIRQIVSFAAQATKGTLQYNPKTRTFGRSPPVPKSEWGVLVESFVDGLLFQETLKRDFRSQVDAIAL